MESRYNRTFFLSSAAIVFMLVASAVPAAADLIIARASTSGACHVQDEKSRPILGKPLAGKYAGVKAACDAAKALYTDDPSDEKKCQDFTRGTMDACKKAKVELKK